MEKTEMNVGSEKPTYERARAFCEVISRKKRESDMDYYKHTYNYYVHPVRIYGNLWYVGDRRVCLHLVDTGDGLVLIDAGYPNQAASIINAIWEAGFSPYDVKYVIVTHEHFDHFGCAELLRAMFGSKIVMSKEAADVFRKYPERTMINGTTYSWTELSEPDIEVNDGDDFILGNLKMRFRLTPGHAEGVLTMLFDVYDEGKPLRAGLIGGEGLFTMGSNMLTYLGIPFSIRDQFRATLTKLKEEHVDICLGNHPFNNNTLGKIERFHTGETNPFINPEEWKTHIDSVLEKFEEFRATANNPEWATAPAKQK